MPSPGRHEDGTERVALLLRVSSEEQRDRETIEIQREFLQEYCPLYGLEVAEIYAAIGPGNEELPERYRSVGQPVLVPGDMGRRSYVLAGTEGAMSETFGSSAHGAGRRMGRKKAKGRNLGRELEDKGILVRAANRATVDGEISEAYKDASEVVDTTDGAGIGKKVARLRPPIVVKG